MLSRQAYRDPGGRNAKGLGSARAEFLAFRHTRPWEPTGMVIVQLGAYAYAHDGRLRDVARDVAARRLRFRAGR